MFQIRKLYCPSLIFEGKARCFKSILVTNALAYYAFAVEKSFVEYALICQFLRTKYFNFSRKLKKGSGNESQCLWVKTEKNFLFLASKKKLFWPWKFCTLEKMDFFSFFLSVWGNVAANTWNLLFWLQAATNSKIDALT